MNEQDIDKRRCLRNQYVKAIRKAKKNYIHLQREKHARSGGVWKLIKGRLHDNKEISLDVDGIRTSDPIKVANQLKNTFSEKVESLKKIVCCDDIVRVLRERLPETSSWDLVDCTVDQVFKCIDELKPTLSSGPDKVSNRLLKTLKFEIGEPLAHIFNLSIRQGQFPAIWRSARVRPVLKRGLSHLSSNYRPVALSSNLGKLLERVLRLQINCILEDILPDTMHGFRAGKGTESALIQVMENVKQHRSLGSKVALLALDASAAFNLLDHDLIIHVVTSSQKIEEEEKRLRKSAETPRPCRKNS